MIDHDVGVITETTYEVKKLDEKLLCRVSSRLSVTRRSGPHLPPNPPTPPGTAGIILQAMRIYTKKGDAGRTRLLFGGEVSKTGHQDRSIRFGPTKPCRPWGLARALSNDPRVKDILLRTQREMFTVGAELATTPGMQDRLESSFSAVTPEMVQQAEGDIDDLDSMIDLPPSFIIPGASAASGALDLARTIVRRAERRVVALDQEEPIPNAEVLRYLKPSLRPAIRARALRGQGNAVRAANGSQELADGRGPESPSSTTRPGTSAAFRRRSRLSAPRPGSPATPKT